MASEKNKRSPEYERQQAAERLSKSEAVAKRQRDLEKMSEFATQDLKKSGLTDDTIFEMLPYCAKRGDGVGLLTEVIGFSSIDNVSIPQSGDFYFIPYRQTEGFARVKLEKAIGSAKYLSPTGKLYPNQHMYFLLNEIAKLKKANVPLLLTEGEKKVAAMTQAARAEKIKCACAGFAGVSCWEKCEEWKSFPVPGRSIYIAFDADFRTNRNVQLEIAKIALWTWLHKAEEIKMLTWPVEFKGIDDYLVSGGKLKDLLDSAKQLPEIFRECVLVKIADIVHYAAKYHYTAPIFASLFETVLSNVYKVKSRTVAALFRRETQKLAREEEVHAEQDNRKTIKIEGGNLPEMVDAAEAALVSAGGIYQRSGLLMRVIESSKVSNKGIERDAQSYAILTPVEATWLCEILTRTVRWLKEDKRSSSGWRYVDCPRVVAETLISRGQWKFPHLSGVINAPTLRWDGSILENPGYDPQSCLLYKPTCQFPPVPESPTWDDANAAITRIENLIKDFPFDSAASRSVAISAMLTAVIRRSLRVAPAHGFTAPKMGTGKTLMADLASLVSSGHTATKISRPASSEEERKAFMALLLEGEQIICIDNLDDSYYSDALCTILTETEWANRLLGVNKTPKMPTNSCWFLTGNNLLLSGDLTDRALLATMDAGVERPDERVFSIKDIREHVLANRGRLVIDCLIILRAYHVAGRPAQNMRPYNRFPDWSEWVRSSIIWASNRDTEATENGFACDPCLTREKVKSSDPVRTGIGGLMEVWHSEFGESPVKISDVIKKAESVEALMSALIEFASDKSGKVNPKGVAWKLRKFQGRIECGMRLKQCASIQKIVLWKVEKVQNFA